MNFRVSTEVGVSVIISLIAIAFAAGCIGQAPQTAALTSITKDGVEYEFSNDIYSAMNVTIRNKGAIYDQLVYSVQVWMLFQDNPQDNAYVATAAAELTSKLSKYYAFSLGRIVNISGFDLTRLGVDTILLPAGTLIEFRGPNAGATETSVSMENGRIIVQATNATHLRLAGDRLALVLFEDDLRASGVLPPR